MSAPLVKLQALLRGSLTRKRLKRDPHFSSLFHKPRKSLVASSLYDRLTLDDYDQSDLLEYSRRRYEGRRKHKVQEAVPDKPEDSDDIGSLSDSEAGEERLGAADLGPDSAHPLSDLNPPITIPDSLPTDPNKDIQQDESQAEFLLQGGEESKRAEYRPADQGITSGLTAESYEVEGDRRGDEGVAGERLDRSAEVAAVLELAPASQDAKEPDSEQGFSELSPGEPRGDPVPPPAEALIFEPIVRIVDSPQPTEERSFAVERSGGYWIAEEGLGSPEPQAPEIPAEERKSTEEQELFDVKGAENEPTPEEKEAAPEEKKVDFGEIEQEKDAIIEGQKDVSEAKAESREDRPGSDSEGEKAAEQSPAQDFSQRPDLQPIDNSTSNPLPEKAESHITGDPPSLKPELRSPPSLSSIPQVYIPVPEMTKTDFTPNFLHEPAADSDFPEPASALRQEAVSELTPLQRETASELVPLSQEAVPDIAPSSQQEAVPELTQPPVKVAPSEQVIAEENPSFSAYDQSTNPEVVLPPQQEALPDPASSPLHEVLPRPAFAPRPESLQEPASAALAPAEAAATIDLSPSFLNPQSEISQITPPQATLPAEDTPQAELPHSFISPEPAPNDDSPSIFKPSSPLASPSLLFPENREAAEYPPAPVPPSADFSPKPSFDDRSQPEEVKFSPSQDKQGERQSVREKDASPPPEIEVIAAVKRENANQHNALKSDFSEALQSPAVVAEQNQEDISHHSGDLPPHPDELIYAKAAIQPTFRIDTPQIPRDSPAAPITTPNLTVSSGTENSVNPSFRTPSFTETHKPTNDLSKTAAYPSIAPEKPEEAKGKTAVEVTVTPIIRLKESPPADSISDSSSSDHETHTITNITLPALLRPGTNPSHAGSVLRPSAQSKVKKVVPHPPLKPRPKPTAVKSRSRDASLSLITPDVSVSKASFKSRTYAKSPLNQTLPQSIARKQSRDWVSPRLQEPDFSKKGRTFPNKHGKRTQTPEQRLVVGGNKKWASPYDFQWSKRMLERVFRIGVEMKTKQAVYFPDMKVRKLRKANGKAGSIDLEGVKNEMEMVSQIEDL